MLKQNIVALRKAFTIDGVCAIDGFDIDCEEDVGQDTIVRFCEMVFDLGFKVTFCPYDSFKIDWWQGCMQILWKRGHKVSWWNLQCYAGGFYNLHRLQPWIDALTKVVDSKVADGKMVDGDVVSGNGAAYLVPGLAVAGEYDVRDERKRRCPSAFETIAAGWKNPKLGGMFLWRYDCVSENPLLCDKKNNLAEYVEAINKGLKG